MYNFVPLDPQIPHPAKIKAVENISYKLGPMVDRHVRTWLRVIRSMGRSKFSKYDNL